MPDFNTVARIAIWALPVVFAITVHEVAHGWVARKLGDSTAYRLGRLTLNPIRHIDPIGTILVPGMLLLIGGIVLGWAKPVPVVMRNLRHPRRDMAIVALAGPMANLVMALAWCVVVRVAVAVLHPGGGIALGFVYMGLAGILINLVLMVINLLPIPPLDGGRVVASLIPPRYAGWFTAIERFGLLIVLGLLATGLLGRIVQPPLGLLVSLLAAVAGIPPAAFGQL